MRSPKAKTPGGVEITLEADAHAQSRGHEETHSQFMDKKELEEEKKEEGESSLFDSELLEEISQK